MDLPSSDTENGLIEPFDPIVADRLLKELSKRRERRSSESGRRITVDLPRELMQFDQKVALKHKQPNVSRAWVAAAALAALAAFVLVPGDLFHDRRDMKATATKGVRVQGSPTDRLMVLSPLGSNSTLGSRKRITAPLDRPEGAD